MKDNVRLFMKLAAEILLPKEPIVEVGSMQVEGQIGYADLRPFFGSVKYVGCDMRYGEGVNQVHDSTHLAFKASSISTVICSEMLEHAEDPIRSVSEMIRILTDDGIILATSQMDFMIHAYPHDYWRFTPQGFDLLFKKTPLRMLCEGGYELSPHSIFIVASKTPDAINSLLQLRDALHQEMPKVEAERSWYPDFASSRLPHVREFRTSIVGKLD